MPQWKLYFRFTKQFNLEQITYLEVDVYGPPCISAVVGVEATIFPPSPHSSWLEDMWNCIVIKEFSNCFQQILMEKNIFI